MQPLSGLLSLHASCQPPCITPRCSRGDCSLHLPTGQAMAVDCDRCTCIPQGARRPDFILLYQQPGSSSTRWIVVEMKSRVGQAGQIVEQLQAGADLIQSNTCFHVKHSPLRLLPLLLHSRGIHTADVQVINSRRVTFRGRAYPILSRRCGLDLMTVL